MRIGYSISGRGPAATQHVARLADAAGIDLVTMGDSQATHHEIYSMLAITAAATSRIQLGPFVTNPVTRHASVTAAAVATVDEISGGRAFLGIGRGNASVKNAGLPRATPEDLRGAIETARRLMGAGPGPGLGWIKRVVPVMVHIGGPRTLQVAVDTADGVIFRWGDFPADTLGERLREIRRLRARGPRAGDPFAIWSIASTCVTSEEARVRGEIDLAHRARSLPFAEWPAELVPAALRFREAYQFAFHVSKTNKVNKRLMDEQGLTKFIVDRYALIGDVPAIARRLHDLEALGVETMILAIEDSGEKPATDETRVADVAAIKAALH